MSKWVTIAPILQKYNVLAQEKFKKIDVGNNAYLDIVPNWVKKENITRYLSFPDKKETEQAISMFISKYEATSLGDPDSNWPGETKRGKQNSALEKIQISNLALWLVQPSPLAFDLVFHINEEPIRRVIQCFITFPIKHHKRDASNYHSKEQLSHSKDISLRIQALIRNNSLWLALRTLFDALRSVLWETRFLLLWVTLEALFGTSTELRYRISHRIGFFLSSDRMEAKKLCSRVKNSYDWRSKIIHGARYKLRRGESEKVLYETEHFARDALLRIMTDESLITVFSGDNKEREAYLDDLVFL